MKDTKVLQFILDNLISERHKKIFMDKINGVEGRKTAKDLGITGGRVCQIYDKVEQDIKEYYNRLKDRDLEEIHLVDTMRIKKKLRLD